MSELERFLEGSRGGATESQGKFTVDLERALEKLVAFSLPGQGLYLGKLLQAANALGAKSLEVRARSTQIEARFLATCDRLEMTSFSQALMGRCHWPSSGARHLGLALRAALANPHHRLELSIGGERLKLTPHPVELLSRACDPHAGRQVLLRQQRGPWLRRLTSREPARQVAAEHEVMYSHAGYSPLTVKFDGRVIPAKGWPQSLDAGHWWGSMTEPYYLMSGYAAPSDDLPPILFPGLNLGDYEREPDQILFRRGLSEQDGGFESVYSGLFPKAIDLFAHLATLHSPDDEWTTCGAAFALPIDLEGPARLTLLQDGVPLSPHSLDLGCPGLLCRASGEGLDVDLSQVQVVQNEAFQHRVKAIRRALQPFLRAVLSRTERFGPVTQTGYIQEVRRGIRARLARIKLDE